MERKPLIGEQEKKPTTMEKFKELFKKQEGTKLDTNVKYKKL